MAINIFKPISFGKEVFHLQSYDENSFVINYTLDSGGGVPPQIPIYMDEHFLIMQGEITFNVDGKKIEKKKGEDIFVSKGIVHSIKNGGTQWVFMTVT